MIEFKQIIGRGTRMFESKSFFTIYDFVKAHYNFSDPQWNGAPLPTDAAPDKPCDVCNIIPCICICNACGFNPCNCINVIKETPPEKYTPNPCETCGAPPCCCNLENK